MLTFFVKPHGSPVPPLVKATTNPRTRVASSNSTLALLPGSSAPASIRSALIPCSREESLGEPVRSLHQDYELISRFIRRPLSSSHSTILCVQLWLNRERQKYHRRQVRKVLTETRIDAVAAAEPTAARGRPSLAQPVSARDA